MASLAPGTPAEPGLLSDSNIDVRYYLQALWRGRWLIAATAVVTLLLGVFIAYLQVPQYRASVLLQIEPPVPTFLNVNEAAAAVSGGYWMNTDFYNTQFRILRSKSVGERVVERLKLHDREPFKSSPDPAGLLMAQVSVEPIPDSRLAAVVVIHDHPQEAALWANTVADEYMAVSLANRVESAKKAYEWLQERLSSTQEEMRNAQSKLFQSLQRQDLFVPEGSVSAVTASITKLNEDSIEATARRISIEAALKQVAGMRERGESLDSVPQISSDSAVAAFNNQLVALSLELTKLKEKYREGHPDVQRVRTQIEEITRAKERRWNEVVDGLKSEYAQLQRREAELKAATDRQKAQAASQSRRITELETLKKESESAKGLYDVLLQKLNESDIASSIRNNNISIIERAVAPRDPVKPNKRRIAGVAFLLGLALGVGLVLGRDYLDPTLKDPEEVERYLHLDLLASVPRYEEGSAHLVTEAYQNLRTSLIFARKDDAGQVVLITGSAPQEGKTTTLVNIGKLLAASGEKTIVLDFDLRRATLHQQLGLMREPGITNYFVSHDDLNALIRPTRIANLFALTAGPIPPNPPALLARKQLGDLLAQLRQHFDWVLLDSPPLASVTDALLLARHADMAVMVVQHNKVDKKVIKRCVGALQRVIPALGVVLNAVDAKSKGYYYYYYHHPHELALDSRAEPPKAAGAQKS